MYIGLDIGGTKIKGLILSDDGVVLLEKECLTGKGEQINLNILNLLQEMIFELEVPKYDPKSPSIGTFWGIGVISFGKVDIESGIVTELSASPSAYSGTNLKELIREVKGLEEARIVVDNDVNGALWGELSVGGAAWGKKSAVMIALGTGVGGANYVAGNLWRGDNYLSGEYGHSILYPHGKKCYCGALGCVEQYLSGTALQIMLKDKLGKNLNAEELNFELNAGNVMVEEVFDIYLNDLALLIYNIEKIINPEIIVIGGGVSASFAYFEKRLRQKMEDSGIVTEVAAAAWGNMAGCRGAIEMIRLKNE